MNPLLLTKLFKFIIVGFSGLFIDFGTTYTLKEKVKIHKYISNAFGFILAATTNYILNRIWTFHSQNPEIAMEYGKFIIVAVIGLAINTFVIWLLVSKMNWHFYVSKLVATAIVTIWNFGINLLYTFV